MKRRYLDILYFCERYMRENGYPPSVREIGDGVGLKSTSSVCQYMKEMRKLGLIISGPELSPRAFTIPGARYVFDDVTVKLNLEPWKKKAETPTRKEK